MTRSRVNVDTSELPKELVELSQRISQLSSRDRVGLEPLLDRVVQSTQRRRRIMRLVQEALSQLRLDMKYLVFDLEATRRERDMLKEQSEGE
ncbi:MAG: transcriptional regulator [Planctomycetota bacterium]|nr:transcriptional regulator [Planctomycetota bacterium]